MVVEVVSGCWGGEWLLRWWAVVVLFMLMIWDGDWLLRWGVVVEVGSGCWGGGWLLFCLCWWFEVGSGCCFVYVDDLRWGVVVVLFMLMIWGGESLLICLCWWNCWPSLFKHHKNQHSNPLQYVYGNLKQYAIYLHLSSRLWVSERVSDCCLIPTQQ